MKICAIICEYNPFHNGHLYQLREAKRLSGANALLCLMSGNFVQRGESALLDKYTRARHAILAGADIVLELPTLFATSNAELFASGAISILSNIPNVTHLCFGAETADKDAFLSAAKLSNEEPQEVSQKIKALTSSGMSYAKARATAYANILPSEILSSPNNILGVEYTKALLKNSSKIEILPIKRVGAGYNDKNLSNEISSATAIRNAIRTERKITNEVPDFVLKDLPTQTENSLELLEKHAILYKSATEIKQICDCTEGLENALKKVALTDQPIVETLTSARYTSSRIRRIALQNLLNIPEKLIRKALQSHLYLSVLAVKKENEKILSILGNSPLPLLVRTADENNLSNIAKECFKVTAYADGIYNLLYPSTHKAKNIFI